MDIQNSINCVTKLVQLFNKGRKQRQEKHFKKASEYALKMIKDANIFVTQEEYKKHLQEFQIKSEHKPIQINITNNGKHKRK